MRPRTPRVVFDTNVYVSAFGYGGRPARHIIISGDKHLLRLGHFRGIRIMRVSEFLESLGEG